MSIRPLRSPLIATAAAAVLFIVPSARASQNGDPAAGNDSGPDPAKPVAAWRFDGRTELGTWTGTPKLDEAGPRTPVYPDFSKDNKAALLSGKGDALVVPDAKDQSLRLGLGDAVTLEAWVNMESIKSGAFSYVIGKGRNRKPGFPEKNQNYALRVKGDGNEGRLCFLFTSAPAGDVPADWHRWTSDSGFSPGTGWHHIAVTYKFGKKDSIRGYVDGKTVKGSWDMGGATNRAPVTDADDLVIGTGNGGGASNSFTGALDSVMIWREALPEATLAARFRFEAPAPAVDRKTLPKGKVLVQICENGVPEKNAWPPLPPLPTETYEEDVFGLFELPQKYVDTGVRGDRANPFVLRMAAVVKIPTGKHRLLMRSRNAAHLYIDGRRIMEIDFAKPDSGGHGHVNEQDGYLNLAPDFRFTPPGTQEKWMEFQSKGTDHLVMIEQMVGGMLGKNKRRPEPGEMVVAISLQGSESWELLAPGKRRVPYTDEGWAAFEKERADHLAAVNAKARAAMRAQHDAYWARRRAVAQQWLASTPEVKVPPLPESFPANNAIDHFLGSRIATVAKQNKDSHRGTIDYFKQVQPLLETKCYDCHRGGKAKGGLKLDDVASALEGGESDGAAIVPGKPNESALLVRILSDDEDEVMPPKGARLTKDEAKLIETWIREGAHWPEIKAEKVDLTPLTDDLAFLRRAFLDTVGVPPSLAEIDSLTGSSPHPGPLPREREKFAGGQSRSPLPAGEGKGEGKLDRAAVIEKLLSDPRWADHWMGYWQDVLAENPNILNPTLNNTGPFRWWIYESLQDNKPMNLFATELIRMRGSERFGGPAGFGIASQNDVPMAAKGTIVGTAFLGVEMKCARCHDAPAHKSTQEDLFQLAALLNTKPLDVPMTSSVRPDRLNQPGRKSLITVTLKPGTKVEPRWPFDEFCDEADVKGLMEDAANPRDRLAALITAPQNERFAQVIANRIWKRFMGRGIVEPVDDWEKGKPTHPELLKWLGRELVRSGYDMKHLARLIMNSHAYQRATDAALRDPSPLYTGPAPRRLAAEQIVDSLFAVTGKPLHTEEVSLDIDGRRDLGNSISLGKPHRAWMLTSTSNERDRPSLALPRIQAVADVLQAFGWRGSRQDATSVREQAPNVLQPAILSNGTMGIWLTRLSDDHGITTLALQHQPLEQLIEKLYLRLLTRRPTAEELELYRGHLASGYDHRKTALPGPKVISTQERKRPYYVSWSNHLDPDATIVRQQQEVDARRGDPPTQKLSEDWRTRLEDVVWALLNSPEFAFSP